MNGMERMNTLTRNKKHWLTGQGASGQKIYDTMTKVGIGECCLYGVWLDKGIAALNTKLTPPISRRLVFETSGVQDTFFYRRQRPELNISGVLRPSKPLFHPPQMTK